jgi:hypothetical protein
MGLAAARPAPAPETTDFGALLAHPVEPLGVQCHA